MALTFKGQTDWSESTSGQLRNVVYQDQYSQALDQLRMLAQRDLLAWWKQTEGMGFAETMTNMEDPFAEIAATYGYQATSVAADYLFLQRSLDEDLRYLPYPEIHTPEEFDRAAARASYNWARRTVQARELSDPEAVALAQSKLTGITDRLITTSASDVVQEAAEQAGTRFARLPEPNACPFCLMLAAEPRYKTRESAQGKSPYHDRCKCVPIEVKSFDDLPQINKDLHDEWQKVTWDDDGPVEDQWEAWNTHMKARVKEGREGVRWPAITDVRQPTYRISDVAGHFSGPGHVEKLPELDHMPGHVLFGWRDKPSGGGHWVDHLESSREGHLYGSTRPTRKKKSPSMFPEDWSKQKIVDSVRDTLESPQRWKQNEFSREVWTEKDGVVIYARYTVLNGRPKPGTLEAYPVDKLPAVDEKKGFYGG